MTVNNVLDFQGICYDVVIKTGPDAGSNKRILHDVTAQCISGRLTALMGPSGAGKSSLLDILAGVKVSGRAQGHVLVNGMPRKQCGFAALASYVQQKDVLVPSATVREALLTSALLKLPSSMTKAEKLHRVDTLLQLLELNHVRDSLIGDESLGIKGISGGEKRRVSVGVEVVKDPAIIFLDEPTTGLDSEMALGVITSLKTMAQAGKMVVATIHQPNSLITDHFDAWALLAQGRLLYSGPWSDAVPYFDAAGYACPMYRNPTDYFMSLASSIETVLDLEQRFIQHKQQLGSKDLDCTRGLVGQQQPFKGFAGVLDQRNSNSNSSKKEQFFPLVGSQQQQQQLLLVQSVSAVRSSKADDIELCFSDDGLGVALPKINLVAASGDSVPLRHAPNSSISSLSISGDTGAGDTGASSLMYWYHVWVLMVRFSKSWVRTPIMAIAEAVQYVILSLFLGLLYLRSPLALPNAPFDRMGAMFVVLTMLSLTPSYTVLVMWDHERQLLRRETSTNMYKRSAFFLAKTLITIPMELVQVSVFAVVTYFMFGFQATAAKFLIYWTTLVVFALCSETLGYMAAIVTPDSKVGVAVLSIFLLLLISFSGYLVRTIPVYFAWIQKISYFSFASNILVENEFAGLNFTGPGGIQVPGLPLIPAAMRNGLSLGSNLGVLVGITVGSRLVCLMLLEAAAYWRFL